MTRALPLLLLLTACVSIPGLPRNIGHIEDPNVRDLLRPLALTEESGCTLTVRGKPLAMKCRVFRGPAEERIVGVYDLVTDTLRLVMQIHEDGTQRVLWVPVKEENASKPKALI